MHLVLLNQYYPPDAAPTGLMLEAVAEALITAGHQVTVLAASGGYAGGLSSAESTAKSAGSTRDGDLTTVDRDDSQLAQVRVIRIGATRFGRGSFLGKLADYLSYYGGVKLKLATLQPRPDRVVALTTPPFLSIIARLFSKIRRADHAHWVMDLYPDVMNAHGMLSKESWGFGFFAHASRFGFGGGRCAAVVTLGPDMAERVAAYLPKGQTANWVPLWETEAEIISTEDQFPVREGKSVATVGESRRLLRFSRGWEDEDCIFMYSGNMGLGHRLGEFLSAAIAPSNHGRASRWVFYGGGKRRGEVEAFLREHPQSGVELHDYVPRECLAAHLNSADVHLTSLEPSWDGTMLPSKLQGIFAVAKPVIFIGSRQSSIARWIEESGGGWVVTPDNLVELSEAVAEAMDPAVRTRKGRAAAEFHQRHFLKATNATRVAAILARQPRNG